jgi:hypothetical protein
MHVNRTRTEGQRGFDDSTPRRRAHQQTHVSAQHSASIAPYRLTVDAAEDLELRMQEDLKSREGKWRGTDRTTNCMVCVSMQVQPVPWQWHS